MLGAGTELKPLAEELLDMSWLAVSWSWRYASSSAAAATSSSGISVVHWDSACSRPEPLSPAVLLASLQKELAFRGCWCTGLASGEITDDPGAAAVAIAEGDAVDEGKGTLT